MNYDTIQELIQELQTYEKETGQSDLSGFSVWLYDRRMEGPSEEGGQEQAGWTIDAQLVYAIGTLYAHARHYVKTALRDTPLVSMHDFGFLAGLNNYGDQRKSDLIAMNYLEMSSGVEVIKRLLRNQFIEEFPDPEDRRSRRVRITPQGRAVLSKVLLEMNKVARIVGGHLSRQEKVTLLPPMMKLLAFHRPIWEEDLGEPLDTILDKYELSNGPSKSN